jgi:fumarylacetoacetase
MELTQGGKQPVQLPSREARTFIEHGDEIIQRGRGAREGCTSIGFGEAAGRVLDS